MESRRTNSGETISSWMEVAPFFPQIGMRDRDCDVCIIGAGIAGLCTAYQLARAGKSVVVVDMGPIAGGQTGRTSAHLTWMPDIGLHEYQARLGDAETFKIIDSHRRAIEWIERVIEKEEISCDFLRVDGYRYAGATKESDPIRREHRTLRDLGIGGVDLKNGIPNLFFDSSESLCVSEQAQFHPIRFMNGLARAIEQYGGQIITDCRVTQVQDKPAQVQLAGDWIVRAKKIIVATNSPINDQFTIHTKQAPYRSYVLAAKIPKGSVPWALYWDLDEPYHYVRVSPDDESDNNDLLIVGGEDHKTGQDSFPQERIHNLKAWALAHFPMIQSFKSEWSGQVWYTNDGLAFVGRNPGDENTYVVTGDSGQGLTYAAIAALMIPDLIEGKEHGWKELYDPSRTMFGVAGEYLRENLNVAWQYSDYFRGSELEDMQSLSSGEGAVITKGFSEGFRKVAVFKNAQGGLTELSAVCPHMGGVVHWNSVEKSWDCPCHGSRFSTDGSVITGPALSGLEALREGESYVPQVFQPSAEDLRPS